jgi:hypothetical protein
MAAGIAEHVRIEDHQQYVTPTTESFCDDSERIMLLSAVGWVPPPSLDRPTHIGHTLHR